jgi:hypothetical protein
MSKRHDPLKPLKREARELGLRWADVEAAYRQLKQEVREEREHPNTVRETAWCYFTALRPGCWPFWRHGFLSRYGRKLSAGGDYTCVPGYDTLAQEMASLFPEFATDDGTERLWDFLFSPYERLPDRITLYRRALEWVAGEREEAAEWEETMDTVTDLAPF